jgi:hypothetical protein
MPVHFRPGGSDFRPETHRSALTDYKKDMRLERRCPIADTGLRVDMLATDMLATKGTTMPAEFSRSFRISAGALASIFAITAVTPANFPRLIGSAQAQAQAPGPSQEQIDFDAALEGYGHWVQHPQLGDVWIPDNVPQDWQPYRIGHWVYTDQWGWYWNSDEDFGWITYHYGRWYPDRQLGWVWVPSDEWGPAWVNWRQGDNFVGWAPTPPDEYVEAEEEPDNYMFVEAGDLLAPQVYTVFIPYRDRRNYYHRSRLVNRTIIFADRRGAVNPGIPPAYIASASGRPFHYSHVAPIVLAGTIGVAGAIILRNNYRDRSRTRISVRETDRVIRPGERFQPLPGLHKGERGRFWNNNEFRAAQNAKPVLNFNDQRGKQQRYIRTKGDASKFEQRKTEDRRIDSKQIEQKNLQQKKFEPRNTQQQNLQQQNTQQKNLQQQNIQQQKIDADRRRRDEDRKRSDENRKSEDRKDQRWNDTQKKNIEQRNLQQQNTQQRNLQQNNQQEKKWGGGSSNQPNRVQQNNSQQQNTQQNNQRQKQNRGEDKDKKTQ